MEELNYKPIYKTKSKKVTSGIIENKNKKINDIKHNLNSNRN